MGKLLNRIRRAVHETHELDEPGSRGLASPLAMAEGSSETAFSSGSPHSSVESGPRAPLWLALETAVPSACGLIQQDGHQLVWLECQASNGYWVTTPPEPVDGVRLAQRILLLEAHVPDPQVVSLNSASGLVEGLHPARRAVLRARYSRTGIRA